MNIDQPITNEALVDIIGKVKQNEVREELFWKEIFKAKFLCPVIMNIAKNLQNDNSTIVLEEGTNISLLSIDNSQGEHFLMAFTDWNEVRKWKQEENQQTLVLTYEDYQGIILKNDSPYHGVVINPFGENVVLSRQLMINTRGNEHTLQKGETVMLGVPKEYPSDMINKLKEYFTSTQNVDKAYLLWMVQGETSSYLLVLDTRTSPQRLFPAVGQVCQPYLNGKLLDMVLVDSNLGKIAIEEQAPFYVK